MFRSLPTRAHGGPAASILESAARPAGIRGIVYSETRDRARQGTGSISRENWPAFWCMSCFTFAWVRLGNPARRSYESLVREEWKHRARGELGWSAESRKRVLSNGSRRKASLLMARLPVRKLLRHGRLDLFGCPPASGVHAGGAASEPAGGMVSRRVFSAATIPVIERARYNG